MSKYNLVLLSCNFIDHAIFFLAIFYYNFSKVLMTDFSLQAVVRRRSWSSWSQSTLSFNWRSSPSFPCFWESSLSPQSRVSSSPRLPCSHLLSSFSRNSFPNMSTMKATKWLLILITRNTLATVVDMAADGADHRKMHRTWLITHTPTKLMIIPTTWSWQ